MPKTRVSITFTFDPANISATALMQRVDQALCEAFDSRIQFDIRWTETPQVAVVRPITDRRRA